MNLPSLNALRVFEAAARHQSLIKASEELCVTQGAVSRQIKQLEETLGVILFERRNRAVFLTPDGIRLRDTCREMFDTLETGLKQIGKDLSAQPLVVSCEPTIMMRWLIPRLARFKEQYPHIQVHLFAAGGPIEFSRNHVDLAVRRDDFNWDKRYFAQQIGLEYMGPVCVPELAAQPFPAKQATGLHTLTRPNAWQHWAALTEANFQFDNNSWFEHFYIMLEAVNAGYGIGISSIYMVEQEIKNQRLIAPCGFVPDGSSYYLLSSQSFESDERRMAFLNWIRLEFKKTKFPA